MPLILPARTLDSGYEIDNSLRFNDDDSPKLSRSISSSGSSRNATFSVWVKRGNLGTRQQIYSNKTADSTFESMNIYFNASNDRLYIDHHDGSSYKSIYTNMQFRDVSAWYHIVHAIDTTTGTATNRLRLYVNGVEETDFATDQEPSQNADLRISDSTGDQSIGDDPRDSNDLFDGYMAEYNFVDGTTLDPTYFGEFNDNGVWIPKAYDGSYGTNGFFLEFQQTGTSQNSSGIGADTSGNDNHFAVTNLTATDQTTDTPTNNFMTMNPLATGSRATFSEGNIKTTLNLQGSVPYGQVEFGTFAVNKGKWYYEVFIVENGAGGQVAIGWNEKWESNTYTNGHNNLGSNGNAWYGDDGNIKIGSATTQSTGVDTFADTDIIGCAIDLDNNKVYWHKNGNYQDDPTPSPASNNGRALSSSYNGYWTPWVSKDSDNASHNPTINWNFGNPINTPSSGNADANGYGNFEYAVPSGYYSLCTKNLAEYG